MIFEKWEGLGNDFVVVGDPRAGALTDDQIRHLCDRRLGVGADGVLILTGLEELAPRMVVRNADGSRPEMCGNGLRCVVGYVLERIGADLQEAGEPRREEHRALVVETDAGARRCVGLRTHTGWDVEVDMGAARPTEWFEAKAPDGRALVFHGVDVGNPHAICFEGWRDEDVDALGPELSKRPPAGTNVEFCRVSGDRIETIVWERGVGRTLACGTGACAVAFAARATGHTTPSGAWTVALPGGELVIRLASDGTTRMRGPARRVFVGEF